MVVALRRLQPVLATLIVIYGFKDKLRRCGIEAHQRVLSSLIRQSSSGISRRNNMHIQTKNQILLDFDSHVWCVTSLR